MLSYQAKEVMMKKMKNRLMVLILGSLVLGTSAFSGTSLSDLFIIKVKTDNEGSSNDNQFTLPVRTDKRYIYNIDCDPYHDLANGYSNQKGSTTCTYPSAGTYTIWITGANPDHSGFPAIYFNLSGDRSKILEVLQWGSQKWKSMQYAFSGAGNLIITAGDNPDLSQVTDMYGMFFAASKFNTNIGDWNVSNVTDMGEMFAHAFRFNQNIGNWNVSNVTNMREMFSWANAFNQDIGDWNVSNVTDMREMFYNVYNLNQYIGNWNVSNVTDMREMFSWANAFNQDIGDWNVSNVTDMYGMFSNTNAFNQDIGDWNVSNVTDMEHMFHDTHLSVSNYDNLLISWDQLSLQNDVRFHAGFYSKYCKGFEAHDHLIDSSFYNWSIFDGDVECEFHIITSNEVTVKSGEKTVINVDANEGKDTNHHIVGGADRDKFTISGYGQLEFKVAPDINNPTDKNGDNIYRVQVDATNDGYTTDYQTIKVKVVSDSSTALVPVIMYLLN